MAEIARIRCDIQKLRRLNTEQKSFIPHGTLDSCLTRETIKAALTYCKLEASTVPQVVRTIEDGAKKTFAILILAKEPSSIIRFIEHDALLDRTLDSQIPFAKEDLQRIIPHAATDFDELQWQFAAPLFSQQLSHRWFRPDTRLPFLESALIGSGGFGKVFRVKLPAGHHAFAGISPSHVSATSCRES